MRFDNIEKVRMALVKGELELAMSYIINEIELLKNKKEASKTINIKCSPNELEMWFNEN